MLDLCKQFQKSSVPILAWSAGPSRTEPSRISAQRCGLYAKDLRDWHDSSTKWQKTNYVSRKSVRSDSYVGWHVDFARLDSQPLLIDCHGQLSLELNCPVAVHWELLHHGSCGAMICQAHHKYIYIYPKIKYPKNHQKTNFCCNQNNYAGKRLQTVLQEKRRRDSRVNSTNSVCEDLSRRSCARCFWRDLRDLCRSCFARPLCKDICGRSRARDPV